MSRIIALQGIGKSGKTTTLNELHNILVTNSYAVVSGPHRSQKNSTDFWAVYILGNQKVGLSSWGDDYKTVFTGLEHLVNANCDICFCACRTFGSTHKALNSFPGYKTNFIQKSYASTQAQQQIANSTDANTLFSLI